MGQTYSRWKVKNQTALITIENSIPYIPLTDVVFAKVIRVIDGDTIVIGYILHGAYVSDHLRLLGIQAEELHAQDPKVKMRAGVQKQILKNAIEGAVVNLLCSGVRDNFGRLLGVVCYKDFGNLSDYMIRVGGCRRYEG